MDPVLVVILVLAVAALLAGGVVIARRRSLPRAVSPALPAASTTPTRARPALSDALAATRSALVARLKGTVGAEYWDNVEEALIAADLGVEVADDLISEAKSSSPASGEEAQEALVRALRSRLSRSDREMQLATTPSVIVVVGVNGVGKTTSIAKLGTMLQDEGRSVLLGAADTFRAGAEQQLRIWADRLGTEIVAGAQGGDPAAVAFDAVAAAKARGYDCVIIDTAGRLHSETNLMAELSKIVRVLTREGGAIDEILLVLDANTGQNGIAQAREFADAVPLTGLVVTKLDGTARGGVIVAVEKALDVPVKLVGVGETKEAMVPFDSAEFAEGMIGSGQ